MMPEKLGESITGFLALAMALHGLFYLSGKKTGFRERFGDIVTERENARVCHDMTD
jgi:hypothetical protein